MGRRRDSNEGRQEEAACILAVYLLLVWATPSINRAEWCVGGEWAVGVVNGRRRVVRLSGRLWGALDVRMCAMCQSNPRLIGPIPGFGGFPPFVRNPPRSVPCIALDITVVCGLRIFAGDDSGGGDESIPTQPPPRANSISPLHPSISRPSIQQENMGLPPPNTSPHPTQWEFPMRDARDRVQGTCWK